MMSDQSSPRQINSLETRTPEIHRDLWCRKFTYILKDCVNTVAQRLVTAVTQQAQLHMRDLANVKTLDKDALKAHGAIHELFTQVPSSECHFLNSLYFVCIRNLVFISYLQGRTRIPCGFLVQQLQKLFFSIAALIPKVMMVILMYYCSLDWFEFYSLSSPRLSVRRMWLG